MHLMHAVIINAGSIITNNKHSYLPSVEGVIGINQDYVPYNRGREISAYFYINC